MNSLIKTNQRAKVVRAHQTKLKKTETLHAAWEIDNCLEQCRKKIPELLGESVNKCCPNVNICFLMQMDLL